MRKQQLIKPIANESTTTMTERGNLTMTGKKKKTCDSSVRLSLTVYVPLTFTTYSDKLSLDSFLKFLIFFIINSMIFIYLFI